MTTLRLAKMIALVLATTLLLSTATGCWSKRTPASPSGTAASGPESRPPSASSPSQRTPVPQAQPSPFDRGAQPAGALRMLGPEPQSLDPAMAQDVSSWSYLLQIFSGLVGLSDKLEVVPDIASKWQVDSSGKTYTFTLRDNVQFHSGKPVTAADFKYSFERAADPASLSPVAELYLGDIVGVADKLSGRANEISGVRVLGTYELQVTIDDAKPYFLSKLTYPTAFVIDRDNAKTDGVWWEKPNGTGPFRLKSWTKQEEIRLEANERYYGLKPKLAEVSFFLGSGSAVAMYERDQLDVVQVGMADIDRVTDKSNPLNKQLSVVPQLGLWYIGFNTKAKPFDDPFVRQAFSMATDKQRIVDVLLRKTGMKAEGILPPGMPGYDPNLQGIPFDVEKARQMLAQSSYGSADNLPPITLTTAGAGMGQSLADMFQRNLGVEVEVEQVGRGFYEDLAADKFQMFYLGWMADYPDPQDFLDILFHGRSTGNYTRYANPEVDRLIEQARVERDEGRRWTLYRQAEQTVVREAPVVPVFRGVDYVLVKPRVKGLNWTPIGIISLKDVVVEGRAPPGTI